MTELTDEEIRALARLSAIAVSDDDVSLFRKDISNILAYVRQLDELDTDHIEPSYQVTGLHNVSRQDNVQPADVTREQLLALSPDQKDHHIKVPKVL